jgi:GNAT superfamily N-acetyltransferase
MQPPIEVRRDSYVISTDPGRLDVEAVIGMLRRAYWSRGRPRERTERALRNSLVFGLYDGSRQIGVARVVSDYAVFAYLCDVFIEDAYRARGLGKWLIETVMAHPDLQGLRRWTLATRDAHGLYRRYGWSALQDPDGWMEILRPYAGEE